MRSKRRPRQMRVNEQQRVGVGKGRRGAQCVIEQGPERVEVSPFIDRGGDAAALLRGEVQQRFTLRGQPRGCGDARPARDGLREIDERDGAGIGIEQDVAGPQGGVHEVDPMHRGQCLRELDGELPNRCRMQWPIREHLLQRRCAYPLQHQPDVFMLLDLVERANDPGAVDATEQIELALQPLPRLRRT